MRKIKFRAWDKNRRKMASVEGFYNPFSEEDSRTRIILNFDDYIQEKIFLQNRIALMQYTGLKDYNGVEIYEGDIIQSYDGSDAIIPDKFTVERDDFYTGFSPFIRDEGAANRHSMEVIGNVHEHPHLIE